MGGISNLGARALCQGRCLLILNPNLKKVSMKVLRGHPYSQCRLHARRVTTLRQLGQP